MIGESMHFFFLFESYLLCYSGPMHGESKPSKRCS